MSNKAIPCAEITMPLTFDCNMTSDFCIEGNLYVNGDLYTEGQCFCGGDPDENGGSN